MENEVQANSSLLSEYNQRKENMQKMQYCECFFQNWLWQMQVQVYQN